MGLSLLQMRQIARRALGVDSFDEGFDDAGLNLKLNMAWWSFQSKMDIRENEQSIPFVLIPGSRKYAVPGDFHALRTMAIFDFNGPDQSTGYQSKDLDQMTLNVYDSVYNQDITGNHQGMPTHYVRENSFFYMWPTPNLAYNCVLRYWKTLQDLANDQDILPIPESQHQIILMGGIANGFIEVGDLTRMSQAQTFQDKLITEMVPVQADEEMDNRLAHVEVPGREYP